ncbi:hypothetical protein [Desulfobacter postgatei]|uniref:hypothetical protein n=1 Tax=Desulfobacter postgatei TaxID=2293 RepID=UPI002A36049A|nr:hypothetical protein [Desulfobacter postgatei]MDX9963109.1 hypothetical protein [Desulfobacter postgatei]
MINPYFSTSRLSKCCNCLLMFFDHWIPRFVLAPIFFIVPSTILVSSLSNTNLYQQLEASLGPQIAGTLKSSHLLIIIWVVLLTYIGRSLFSIIQHFALEDSELTKKDIVSILNTIDVVVQSKCNRFLRNTKQVLKKKLSSSEIFKMITQPDQQIALIVQAIQGIFETLHGNNTEFRVGLMAVKSEKLTDWFVFAPENKPPKTDAEALSNPSSAIMRALKSKSMIIIEDIQEELKKKIKTIDVL